MLRAAPITPAPGRGLRWRLRRNEVDVHQPYGALGVVKPTPQGDHLCGCGRASDPARAAAADWLCRRSRGGICRRASCPAAPSTSSSFHCSRVSRLAFFGSILRISASTLRFAFGPDLDFRRSLPYRRPRESAISSGLNAPDPAPSTASVRRSVRGRLAGSNAFQSRGAWTRRP